MVAPEQFSKYERARILGARALQISMDAPLLMKAGENELENLNFDPLRLAEKELDTGVLPISINRPLPERREEKLERIKVVEEVGDEKKIEVESKEEKEIAQEGEIMELVSPDDESDLFGEEFDSESSNEE